LVLSLCSARVFITQYTEFKQKTRRDVTELLLQKNLPLRDEQRQVIVSSVLRSDQYKNAIDVVRPTADNVLHAAFAGISTSLLTCGRDRACDEVGQRIADIVRQSYPGIDTTKLAGIAEHIRRFKSIFEDEPIAACDACGMAKNLHEIQFGSAGCDPPPGHTQTSLLIPSRENRCMDPICDFWESCAQFRGTEGCFSGRVRAANDFSLVLEDLAQVLDGAMRTEEPGRGRLVQAYFISPDNVLRYWSEDRKSAESKFARAHLWGATPFMQIPLERFESFNVEDTERSSMESTSEALAGILAEALAEPYVDYGEFGLVKTKCTPVLGDGKRIIGVLCTDVTVPPRPMAPVKDQLVDWFIKSTTSPFLVDRTVVLDPRHCVDTLSDAHENDKHTMPPLEFRAQLCAAIDKQPSLFFQKVQELQLERGETVLAVPLGRTLPENETLTYPEARSQASPAGAADMLAYTWRRVMLLRASTPQLPHGSIGFLVGSLLALFTVLGMRIYFERSHRARAHEDTLLRDLQVGVLDVSDGHVIVGANDRAEELLGVRLPTLGARWDVADSRKFFEFVDDILLFRNPDRNADHPAAWRPFLRLSKDQIRRDRALGLSYEYYARLKKPIRARRGRIDEKPDVRAWLRVRGSPILTSTYRIHGEGDRTFAVIHTVSEMTEVVLNKEFEARGGVIR
jgi:PAS domain-containing protein